MRGNKKEYDHIISLGYNCEVAFRFVRYFNFEESSLFNWTFSNSITDIINAINQLDEIGKTGFKKPKPLWECNQTHIQFHGKANIKDIVNADEDLLKNDEEDLFNRIAYLKRKFLIIAQDNSKKLYVYKTKKEDITEDVINKIQNLYEAIERIANNFQLLIICEKFNADRFTNTCLDNVYFRFVEYFADDGCVTNKKFRKNGFDKIWHEFKMPMPKNINRNKTYKFQTKRKTLKSRFIKLAINFIPFSQQRQRLRSKYHVK